MVLGNSKTSHWLELGPLSNLQGPQKFFSGDTESPEHRAFVLAVLQGTRSVIGFLSLKRSQRETYRGPGHVFLNITSTRPMKLKLTQKLKGAMATSMQRHPFCQHEENGRAVKTGIHILNSAFREHEERR